ncbi:MAG: CooT family nickel-binding protein [Deltaproteobacteria bacterium]|nr:CooT family nickel-binding protein [Deltaproteobacteria bacterium]MBW2140808.1 CooT family nickel-binding protein [Deltaproteobacteria bacterium]MBW2324454.1 CooT family nickel-binding protein [Deltaproteobacteria bacterium]
MCEASAFKLKNGQEELLLEAVDLIEPETEDSYRIVSIFGEQKVVKGKIKVINLVNHKIVFED